MTVGLRLKLGRILARVARYAMPVSRVVCLVCIIMPFMVIKLKRGNKNANAIFIIVIKDFIGRLGASIVRQS